jgi:hypothetical protein
MMAFPSSISLCDDPSEDSVIGKRSILRLQDEGCCGEQHQGLSLVQRPRQPLTDGM